VTRVWGITDWRGYIGDGVGELQTVVAILVTELGNYRLSWLYWWRSWRITDCRGYIGDGVGELQTVVATLVVVI